MDKLEATLEFEEATKEIELLIAYSRRNKKDFLKYATFNKAAIVLLCTKFEAFLEEFLEEYAYLHIEKSSNKNLDSDIFEHLVDNLILSLENNKLDKTKRREAITELVMLCGDVEVSPISCNKIDTKFRDGKHGQREVEKLLKTFGFASFIEENEVKFFFKKFNSLNMIRNNIIHEHATPTLTHQDVEAYLSIVSNFITKLNNLASAKIAVLIENNTH